jgi:hypothetical protein
MEAINLIYRYNEGRIDIDQTGIFTCISMEYVKNPAHFSEWMFGGKAVLRGGLKLGSVYIYAYTEDLDSPDGFDGEEPSMVVLLPENGAVFIYEIEDL